MPALSTLLRTLPLQVFTGKIEGCPVILIRPDWNDSNLFRGGRIYGGACVKGGLCWADGWLQSNLCRGRRRICGGAWAAEGRAAEGGRGQRRGRQCCLLHAAHSRLPPTSIPSRYHQY